MKRKDCKKKKKSKKKHLMICVNIMLSKMIIARQNSDLCFFYSLPGKTVENKSERRDFGLKYKILPTSARNQCWQFNSGLFFQRSRKISSGNKQDII